jgi:hypothetical protein
MHNGIRKLFKTKPPKPQSSTTTTYSNILQHARELGVDHSTHAHSDTPYMARRDALEVMWGAHVHRCCRKYGPSLTCTKCQSPLINTHILGGCRFTAKLCTRRHNSTFKHLHQLLQNTDGGRWPVVGMHMGHKPVTDFNTLTTPPLDTEQTQLEAIKHPNQEGTQHDKADSTYPQTIPEYILPAQHRPKHHRPDLIWAVGFTLTPKGGLTKDLTYRGQDSYRSSNANTPRTATSSTSLTTFRPSTNP